MSKVKTSSAAPSAPAAEVRVRIDKWLWAARFFKTRALASDELDLQRIEANGQRIKASYSVKVGDVLGLHLPGQPLREVEVLALSAQRGPAPVAQRLYRELPSSLERRSLWLDQRRLAPDPHRDPGQGRPTKRERRDVSQWQRWGMGLEE
ncbi:RNA-binding S4 domain-containing protein [Amphibiibacter pelophylacis]|uniref:RNA-binding S4 domain-containing protein n=1 Tax=Amphibiibacter pelophylacis TaxID=1799477 RepID=A0ACC6NZS1_9BURK